MMLYVPASIAREDAEQKAKIAAAQQAIDQANDLSRLCGLLKARVAREFSGDHPQDSNGTMLLRIRRLCSELLNYESKIVLRKLALTPYEIGRLISECLLDGEHFEIKT